MFGGVVEVADELRLNQRRAAVRGDESAVTGGGAGVEAGDELDVLRAEALHVVEDAGGKGGELGGVDGQRLVLDDDPLEERLLAADPLEGVESDLRLLVAGEFNPGGEVRPEREGGDDDREEAHGPDADGGLRVRRCEAREVAGGEGFHRLARIHRRSGLRGL